MRMDEALAYFEELILEMYRRVQLMHETALEVIVTGDKSRALQLIRMDEFVNHVEEEINDQAQVVLALLSPVATDLRIVIAGIKIASDLERIGDYAKNIAEYIIRKGPLTPPFVTQRADQIGRQFLKMLEESRTAYQERNVQRAYTIPDEDEVINELFAALMQEIEAAVQRGETLQDVVGLAGVLRNFERAGDHTKNLCEHLIFQIKGQHIDFG